MVTEDAFFSHFYRFNHIILHERRRIPEKRAATGAMSIRRYLGMTAAIPQVPPRLLPEVNGSATSHVHAIAWTPIYLSIILQSLKFPRFQDSLNK